MYQLLCVWGVCGGSRTLYHNQDCLLLPTQSWVLETPGREQGRGRDGGSEREETEIERERERGRKRRKEGRGGLG